MGSHRSYRELRYEFGRQVLTLRTRARLSQSDLAQQSEVHRRSVQNWENGESYPKAETLQRLIAVFLKCQAFTAGNEQDEAHALWSQAAQDGPHALASFDETWFTHTWAAIQGQRPTAEIGPLRAVPRPGGIPPGRTVVDWGEAAALPTLYGRERELETLRQWVVDDRCRVVTIAGLGGIGKSSLALNLAHDLLMHAEVVLFRSLRNGPLLVEVLDQIIRVVSREQAIVPGQVADRIALLVKLFRERRCLLVLDNFESIMQPGTLTGTYRTGYDDYGALLQALSEREHQSCLLLTSREKPAELGPFESRTSPVRALHVTGLDDGSCRMILETKDIVATAADVGALARLYGGNPLALQVVSEPIRELFGGDVGAFLTTGDAFFNGMSILLHQQFARSTALEQTILFWLAIERELIPLSTLLVNVSDMVSQRDVLGALESLRHRMLIERGAARPAFTLQAVILEYVTDLLIETVCAEIRAERPRLLQSHALIQATARNYVRSSQERLIATPLLERLAAVSGSTHQVERQLRHMLAAWRGDEEQQVSGVLLTQQGYGPGNVINLLRVLRGNLRGLDLSRLALHSLYLQGVEMQDATLAGSAIRDSTFTETFDALLSVAISSTGASWAAASRRGEVQVWAVSGLSLQPQWSTLEDSIWALAFSPDGSLLATGGSWDGTVKLWDATRGVLRWTGSHTSHAMSLAFAPDGTRLASGGNDAIVRIWDLQHGTLLHELSHPAPVSSVAWSPGGRVIATGDVEGSMRLWEIQETGVATIICKLAGHAAWVDGLAFAPDGATLASASWDRTARLWDVASGQLSATLAGHSDRVSRVVWSPDGRILASSSRDHTLRLWEHAAGSTRTVLRGHTAGVVGLAFAPDSRNLLSGSEDGTLRLWDVASAECIRVIQGHIATVCDVDWSPDGTHLVSGSADTLVTIFDLTGASPPRILPGHTGVVIGVGWSADGAWLASCEWDNAIRLWDVATGVCLQVLQQPQEGTSFFLGVAWSPTGRRLACATYRHGAPIVALATDRLHWTTDPFPNAIRQVAWSPDGTHLVGAGEDGALHVWDADGTFLRRLTGHDGKILRVAWSPDGTRLVSGGSAPAGGELFVWDAQSGECLRAFAGHPGMICNVAWGADEDQVISADGAGILRWWDILSGACLRTLDAHHGQIPALRRSPDGTRLASCGDDGAIRLWDVRTGRHLQTLRRDRPYERMDITGLTGITLAQHSSLMALGAVDRMNDTY